MSGRPREIAESTSRFSLRTLFATSEESDPPPAPTPHYAPAPTPYHAQAPMHAPYASPPPPSFVPAMPTMPPQPQSQPTGTTPTPPSAGLTFASLGGSGASAGTGASFSATGGGGGGFGSTAATTLKFQLPNLTPSAADSSAPPTANYDATGIPPMLGLALNNAPRLGPAPSAATSSTSSASAPVAAAGNGGATSSKRTLRSGFLSGGGSAEDSAREIVRLNATIDELTESLDRTSQKSYNAEQAIIRGNQMVAQLKAAHEQQTEALKAELRAAQHRESVVKAELAALPRTTQMEQEQFRIAAKSVAELQESRDVATQQVASLQAELAYERAQRASVQTKLDSTAESAQASSAELAKTQASLLVSQNEAESLKARLEALEARVPARFLSSESANDASGGLTDESAAETVTELEAYVAGIRQDADDAIHALESELSQTRQNLVEMEADRDRVASEVGELAKSVDEKTAMCSSLRNDVEEHVRRAKTAELKLRAETERAARAESSSKAAHELMETMTAIPAPSTPAPTPAPPTPAPPTPAPKRELITTLARRTMQPLTEAHAQRRACMISRFEDHIKAWNLAQKSDRHVAMRTAAVNISTLPSCGRIGIMTKELEENMLTTVGGMVRQQDAKTEAAKPGPDRKREEKTKETVVKEMRMTNMLVAVTRDLRAHVQASVDQWERASEGPIVKIVNS